MLALFLSSCFAAGTITYAAVRFAAGQLFRLILRGDAASAGDAAGRQILAFLRRRYRLERAQFRQEAKMLARASVFALEPPLAMWQTRLFAVASAPPFLYAKSRRSPDNLFASPAAAVVGSRQPGEYGLRVTERLVREMTAKGIVTISGGAMGIDRQAHATALANGGMTAAVLAHGIDLAYPAQNRDLFAQIIEQGWLLTEYRPGVTPKPYRFPARNRLVAALADVVIVTSAKKNSGTLITAGFAADQGKPVFAVPGSILKDDSDSCHSLIDEGAGVYAGINDLKPVWPELFQ